MQRTATFSNTNAATLGQPTRRALGLAVLGAAALLAGCSTLRTVTSEVRSYGEWPAGRATGSYAFDRLPSQQLAGSPQAKNAEKLEQAAAAALKKAGFQPVAAGQAPDLLVQVGARSEPEERHPWNEPFWWRGGFGVWRVSPWSGPAWGWSARWDNPRYERSVAVLLRDRASGQPLYEAHATGTGNMELSAPMMAAMFEAALADFPKANPQGRDVAVQMAP
jgi:hypothetical protein